MCVCVLRPHWPPALMRASRGPAACTHQRMCGSPVCMLTVTQTHTFHQRIESLLGKTVDQIAGLGFQMTRIEALLERPLPQPRSDSVPGAFGETESGDWGGAVNRGPRQEPLVLQSSPIKSKTLLPAGIPPLNAGRAASEAGRHGGAGGGGGDRSNVAVIAPSRMGSSALDFYGGGGQPFLPPLPPPNGGSGMYGIPRGVQPGAPEAPAQGYASSSQLQY